MIQIDKHKEELAILEQNIAIYKDSIKEVADEILNNQVSKYPVFIASKADINLGRIIIDKEDLALEWSVFASTLEEFVSRKIITSEKLEKFKKHYKDPELFICLFTVIDQESAGFIFIPYDSE